MFIARVCFIATCSDSVRHCLGNGHSVELWMRKLDYKWSFAVV